jgi:hypothetical protein
VGIVRRPSAGDVADGAIMLNTNAGLWPQVAANSPDAEGSVDPFGLGSIFETQARLWNHLLDANRSLWEFYTPWLSAGQVWAGALTPAERDVDEEEPAETIDGVPDALETQARTWNHMLDANRNFWNAFGFMQVPGLATAGNNASEPVEEPRAAPAKRRAPRKTARGSKSR